MTAVPLMPPAAAAHRRHCVANSPADRCRPMADAARDLRRQHPIEPESWLTVSLLRHCDGAAP